MIGDVIDKNQLNFGAAHELLHFFKQFTEFPKLVVAVAGESGSGKTHMSIAIQVALKEFGRTSLILHMDDFYKLPPKQNHQNRLLSMSNVGPHEVDLSRIQNLLSDFKTSASTLSAPIIDYYKNSIDKANYNVADVDVLIIEGTYAFYLEHVDFYLYMSRNYKETKELRALRNRGNEVNDPFVEKVLEKEHALVTAKKSKANAWIDYDFNLQYDGQ